MIYKDIVKMTLMHLSSRSYFGARLLLCAFALPAFAHKG